MNPETAAASPGDRAATLRRSFAAWWSAFAFVVYLPGIALTAWAMLANPSQMPSCGMSWKVTTPMGPAFGIRR